MNKVNAFVGQVPEKFSSKRRVPKLPLIIIAILAGSIGTYALIRSFAATPNCDQTVSSVSAAQSAVSSAAGGTTVCMAPGSYGSITLSGTHASMVTFQADPSLDPNGAGKVTFSGINVSGTFITVRNFYTTRGLNFVKPAANAVADHNDVTNSPGAYGINVSCNGGTQPGCSYITMNGNRIHDLESTGGDGDGIRLDGWSNVTITANEEFNIVQHPGSDQGHTDCLQSYNAGVASHDFVFDHNYQHDNQCQGVFLSDGSVTHNVTINNNLLVRGAKLGGADTNIFVIGSTDNLLIRNNTTVKTGGSVLKSGGSGTALATVDHNVFDVFNLNPPLYTLTENNNIFTDGNQWSFTVSPTDVPQTYGTKVTPAYMCGSSCGNGTVGGDDYRLASNPNGIGINWAPSQYVYGPVNTSPVSGPVSGPSDTTAPTISLTAPAASATVSGTATTVSATASDDTGVAGVQFKLDGNNLGSEDTSSPYSTTWNTTSASNGTHTLTAVARDAAGNTKTSSSVSVTVNNATASGKRYVATNGNDSGNNCLTQSSPCLTFDRAYSQAALGDTVEVAAGTYGGQTINYVNQSPKNTASDLSDVVFTPASGATVTINGDINVYAFHVTVQNMAARDTDIPYDGPAAVHDVTFKNMDARNFTIDSGVNINILGGDYGPSSSCGGPYGGGNNGIRKNNNTMPSDILISGVNFHDVQSYDLVACHIECLIIGAGDGLTIENSKFRNCSIFDIFLQPFNGAISNVLIQNNWFAVPTDVNGSPNSGRAVEFSTRSPWTANWNNVTVRNNSFNTALNVDDDTSSSYSTYTNFIVSGNILERSSDSANSCNAGVQYNYNVWKSSGCGSSTDVSAGGTFPYVNAAQNASFDYHLKTGSNAIDRVPAAHAPAKDIDGDSRPQGSASDAGADETTGTTPPPPSDTAAPTVAFSSPTNGATVSGTVTATATATDDTGVTKVEISLDSSLKMTDTAAPYNYSFDSKTLSNGSHTLTAKAYDAAGNTKSVTITITVSNPDTTPPNAPTNLNATAPTSTSVNLTWTAATDTGTNPSGVTKYNVLRNGVVIAQPTTTSYTDTGRTANTTYSYVVQAVDAAGNVSANSNTDSVTTPPPPTTPDTTAPTVPGNVAATAASPNQVNISWNASTDSGGSGLAGYNVYRGSTKLNSSPVTTTTYGDSTAAAGTAYSYKVEAVDGAGNKSAQSSSATVTTPAAKRGDITGSSGAPDGKIDLTDISYVIRKYNTTDANGDISGPNGTPDGKVDLFDLSYIIRNYGK